MKSMIVESIHEIFFSRFILNGNELTLLFKHLCLLFLLSLRLHVREIGIKVSVEVILDREVRNDAVER